MANVLITSEYFCKFDDKARRLLVEAGHNVIDNPYGHTLLSPELIIPHAAEAEAMICDLEKINRDVIDAAPRLSIVSRRGVGVDSVDCEYAASKGIEVSKTIGVVEAPVAEIVFAYILSVCRRVEEMSAFMHKGQWNKLLGSSVEGKTLGVAGMGRIGYEVARRGAVFGMNLIYFDAMQNEMADALGAKRVSFDELLAESDFLSLNVALTDETRYMFDYEAFKRMKPSAYVINVARGAVIDEKGLRRALDEGLVAGAGIDVFEEEPEENSALRGAESVLLTPHAAGFTRETFINMDIAAAKNVIRHFNEKR